MSRLVFDGDENSLKFYDLLGRFVRSWPASNRGGPASDFRIRADESYLTHIPDGVYPFESTSQRAPQGHSSTASDSREGQYGTLGILRLVPIKYGGQIHSGLGIHAGRQGVMDSMVVWRQPLQQVHNSGPYYRTNGCIRTTEMAMHEIAKLITGDPLTTLTVKNNGQHPIGKMAGKDPVVL
jgi:hypothetical protein